MRTAILILVALLTGPLTVSFAQNVRVTDSSPPEAKLAAIDQGSTVVSRSRIRDYGRPLNRLDQKCKEPRERIADYAVKGVELLKEKKNVRMSILRFLQAMDESIPKGSESLDLSCAEITALLVTMIDRP